MTIKKFEIPADSETRRTKTQMTVKKGIRVCGIAESFQKEGHQRSLLAGVVQRLDGRIDGFGFATAKIGGLDATRAVKNLLKRLDRPDIKVLLLNGTVIAYYNVIDTRELYQTFQRPIIAITYEKSEGIGKYLMEMDLGEERLKIHRENGERKKIKLRTGKDVFLLPIGISLEKARYIMNSLVSHGKRPEPIRIAKLVAKSAFNLLQTKIE